MNRNIASLFLFSASFVLAPLAALAGPITVPPGLNPGDPYRLVFVTSSMRDATSSDIADYNAFVTTAANSVPELAALGTTWTAMASTASIDARDNTSTNFHAAIGFPVYRLDGGLVASSNGDLWDSSIALPISLDEHASPNPISPWTGSGSDGLRAGAGVLGGGYPEFGNSTHTDGSWADSGAVGNGAQTALYAISGILTAQAPEPSTMVLACLAAAGLAVPSLRRRRQRRP